MVCANGQIDTLNEYCFLILRLNDDLCLELQSLVAPDAEGTPDILFGRDSLSRLSCTLSMTDSLLDIGGQVISLYDSAREAANSETSVVPSLQGHSLEAISLSPGDIKELHIRVSGPVSGRFYIAETFLPNIIVLSPCFDLQAWRFCSSPEGELDFAVFLHYSGSGHIELDAGQFVISLRPIVCSPLTASIHNVVPAPVNFSATSYYREILSSDSPPSSEEVLADAFAQLPFHSQPEDPISAVEETRSPHLAFPYDDPFEAGADYHTGCCLVPRVLSSAEYAEWQTDLGRRETEWAQDDYAKLFSLFHVTDVPPPIEEEFKDMIRSHCGVFGRSLDDLRTGLLHYMAHLAVKDESLVMYSPPRNHNLLLSAAAARYARCLMSAKIAEHSFSPHAANMFCVPKKERLPSTIRELEDLTDEQFLKTFRLVHAFIKLNENLRTSNHTVSSLRQSIRSTRPNMIYSAVDLFQAFFQLLVDPASRDFLAFHVPSLDALLRLCRAAMGLATSSQLLCGYMLRMKENHQLRSACNYQDDVNIESEGWDIVDPDDYELPPEFKASDIVVPNVNYSLSREQALKRHLHELTRFFDACLSYNVILSPAKCRFFERSILKLGFFLSPLGISVPVKTREAILSLRPPTSRTEVRSLLGLVNVISGFIPNYQALVGGLYCLTSSRKTFAWTAEHQTAFEALKEQMHRLPLLAYFFYRDAKELILYSDASDSAGASILMLELEDGRRLPITYTSCKFPASAAKQSIFRKEYYALASALQKSEDILRCCHFRLFIDSKPLWYAITNPRVKLAEQLYRLGSFVSSFSFSAEWVPSKSNLADILTRQVSSDLPELDLSFLDSFQKDITVLGWREDEEPIVPVYFSQFCDPSDISHPCLWDACSSSPTAVEEHMVECFWSSPEGADVPGSDASSAKGDIPGDAPELSDEAPMPAPSSQATLPAIALDEEIVPETIVQQQILDQPWNFHPHQPLDHAASPPEPSLPMPAMLRVFSHLDFLTATHQDEDLNLLIQILSNAQPCPTGSTLLRHSDSFRSLLAQKDLLSVKGGLLFKRMINPSHSAYNLVVPQSLQRPLVAKLHLRFGHAGISSTQMAARRAYYFRGMYDAIRRVILNCSVCLRFKAKTDKAFVGHPLDLGVSRPWESVAFDHFTVGHAPHLKSPFSAVLLGVDAFSNFLVAENVKSLEGKVTAEALRQIFMRFGPPQSIRSDNGTAFRAKEVRSLTESMGITHNFAIPYTPSSNGKVERQVANAKSRLRILLSDSKDKAHWHKFTQLACFAINATIRPSIGYSPFELFMGSPPFIDGTIVFAQPGFHPGSVAEFVARRREFFDSIANRKWGIIDTSRPKSQPPDFAPGDLCFIRNFTWQAGANRQLVPKFEGPFPVLRRINRVTFQVDKAGQSLIVHVKNMRPYHKKYDPIDHTEAKNDPVTSAQDPAPSRPTTRRLAITSDIIPTDLNSATENVAADAGSTKPTTRSRSPLPASRPPLPPLPPLPPSSSASKPLNPAPLFPPSHFTDKSAGDNTNADFSHSRASKKRARTSNSSNVSDLRAKPKATKVAGPPVQSSSSDISSL